MALQKKKEDFLTGKVKFATAKSNNLEIIHCSRSLKSI